MLYWFRVRIRNFTGGVRINSKISKRLMRIRILSLKWLKIRFLTFLKERSHNSHQELIAHFSLLMVVSSLAVEKPYLNT